MWIPRRATLVYLFAFILPMGCGNRESEESISPNETVSGDSVEEKEVPVASVPAPIELETLPEPAGSNGQFSIKQVMQLAHKNKLYRQATSESPAPGALERLLVLYQALPTQASAIGDPEDWKKRSTALVDATQMVIDGAAEAPDAFRRAVNCNSCHSRHKP